VLGVLVLTSAPFTSYIRIKKMIKTAIDVAAQAHAGQVRRGWEDYVYHPLRVAQKCIDAGMAEDYVAAAILHDVVEDSDITIKDLATFGFSYKTVEAIRLLTKLDGETSFDAVRRIIASGNKDAMRIKLFDLEDNMDIRARDYWPGMEEAVIRYGFFHSILLIEIGGSQ
jgi:(p)ppGpp synthase/HD superfamily hydrolase